MLSPCLLCWMPCGLNPHHQFAVRLEDVGVMPAMKAMMTGHVQH